MIENIMEHIAFECQLDAADVRLTNMMAGNKLRELLPQFLASNEYKRRKEEIRKFNSENRWMKRGLGLAVMDFPFHYIPEFGVFPATVAIYHIDGSVVITHGGVEMGQGRSRAGNGVIHNKCSSTFPYCLRSQYQSSSSGCVYSTDSFGIR